MGPLIRSWVGNSALACPTAMCFNSPCTHVGRLDQVPLLHIGCRLLFGARPSPQTTSSFSPCSIIRGAFLEFTNTSALGMFGAAQLPVGNRKL